MRTCPYKDKECPLNYGVDLCTKHQDCWHEDEELENLREENKKLKEQLKDSHFSNVIGVIEPDESEIKQARNRVGRSYNLSNPNLKDIAWIYTGFDAGVTWILQRIKEAQK